MPTVTDMNRRVFYEPDTVNGLPLSYPPSGYDMHERITGWFALMTQSGPGVLAGIPVRYSAKNTSYDDGDAQVTVSWDGGPTAAIVAQVLTRCNGFWEPASAVVDWDAPDQVDVHLFGVRLTLYSRSPEYQAMRDGKPVIDNGPVDAERHD